MSEYVYGQVTAISEKKLDNGGTAYSIKLRYDDGNEDWFGAGYQSLEFGKDSMIEFQANYGDRFNDIVKGSIQVCEYVAPVQQGRGNSGGRQNNGGQRNGGNNSGQSGNSRGGNGSGGNGNGRSQGNGQRPAQQNQGQRPQGNQGGQRKQQQRAPQRQAAPQQQRQAAPSNDGGKSAYWDNKAALDLEKDIKIGSFACVNTAIAIADSVLLNKAFTLGTKKDLKYDAYLALVFKLADQLEVRAQQKIDGTYGAMLPPTDAGEQGYQNSTDGQEGGQYDDDIPQ